MKLYGFPLSPFVRKVAVALAEKGLEFEWEPSNPGAPTEEFLKVSPFSKIPGFADGDYALADSTAIAVYLDAKYPDVPLIPAAPEARGRAVWFDEVVDTVLIPAAAPIVVHRFLRPKIFGQPGDEEAAKAGEEAALKSLNYLEGQLGNDGWLDGEFSLGDIALASSIKTLTYAGWSIDRAAHGKLCAWYDRVSARAAWQAIAEKEAAMFAAMNG
ncbi:glutathione S-transferase family protein [Altererythrobacter salegens]|uniref:glutathione transferase n=1 Tax=Croceibacterium salegens TaxID=1737568 RepID=A0A6I4T0S5_9SPHN|nr:glutathione S-transferase family protein [Croceibacterium salegens]MXO60242.1 glutathione S-transferase family protein [Croceibacterium salegens]